MSAATTTRPKMTLEDWAALPKGEPGELVDGELVDEEMPSFVHEVVVVWHLWREVDRVEGTDG